MKICLYFTLILLPTLCLGKANSYRVAWRGDPATSAVICWNQVSGTNAVVCLDTKDRGGNADAYRHKQEPSRTLHYRNMNNHFVRLENLKPDTAYYFVVKDSEGVGRRLWFRTAPDKPKPFTFISGGDSRTNPEPRREGNKLVAKLRPLFVLFGGDYTGSGKPEEWKEWFADWQLTISEDGQIYPIIATHGNHENADLQMMEHLFDTPHPDQYYSLGIGGDMMRIWVLNSELSAKDPDKVPEQNAWIHADLPQYPDVNWKLVAYHRPMRAHTARKAEGIDRIKAWAQLFYDQGVDAVIESDTHMVKQSYPVRPSTEKGSYEHFIRDDEKGFVFIGEGSWGAPARPADDDKPWTMASASFHQFKWIQAFPDELLIRTVKFDNADAVVPHPKRTRFRKTRFKEPKNMVFWEPESGKVLRLPFDPKHRSYSTPPPLTLLLPQHSPWTWSTNEQDWAEGPAPLDSSNDPEISTIHTNAPQAAPLWFKNEFKVEDPSKISRVFFDLQVNTDCVVTLNGKEVIRHKKPKNKRTSESSAQTSGEEVIPLPINTKHLKPGSNQIKARVHKPDGSALIFDLSVRVKK
jgi:hypothetical protein